MATPAGAASGVRSVSQLKKMFESSGPQGGTRGKEALTMGVAGHTSPTPATPPRVPEQLSSGLQVRISDLSAWGGMDTGGSSAYDSVIAGVAGRGADARQHAPRLDRDLECEETPAKVDGGSLWPEGSPKIAPADRPGLQAVKLHQFLSDIEEPDDEEDEPLQELAALQPEGGVQTRRTPAASLAAAATAAAKEVRKKNLGGRRVQFAGEESGGSPSPAAKAGTPKPAAKAEEAPPAKVVKGFSWLWKRQPAATTPASPDAPPPQPQAKVGASQGHWAKGITAAKLAAQGKLAAEKLAEPKPAREQPTDRQLQRQLTSSDEILRRGSDMSAQLRAIQRRYDGDTSGLMSRKSSTFSELTVASGVRAGGASEPHGQPSAPVGPAFSSMLQQSPPPPLPSQGAPREAPTPAAGGGPGLWARAGVPQSAFAEPAPQAAAGQQQTPQEPSKLQTGAELRRALLKQTSSSKDLAAGAAAALASEPAEAAATPVKARRRLLNPRPAPAAPQSPFAAASPPSPPAPPALAPSRSGKEHSTAAGLKQALLQQASGTSPPVEAPIAMLSSTPRRTPVPRVSSRGTLPEPGDKSSTSLDSSPRSSSLPRARSSLRKVGSKEDLVRIRGSFREDALVADALVRSSLGAALQLAGDSQTYAVNTLPQTAPPVSPPTSLARASNTIVQEMKATAAKRGSLWAFHGSTRVGST